MLTSILAAFEPLKKTESTLSFGSGLINRTWKIETGSGSFILQRINQNVFKHPEHIANNIEMLGNYLQEFDPSYFFVKPVPTIDRKQLFKDEELGYFRLFPFVHGSYTRGSVNSILQASEAAAQFGKFTKLLNNFNANKLHITIPDFHNLGLRYQELITSIESAPAERLTVAHDLVEYLVKQHSIVDTYEKILISPSFQIRVMHHDTKISNVLFDENDKGLCVIDLDTVMPGYFISDLGDMIRTYLSPADEEEKDFSKINIRDDYFIAIIKGYLAELGEVLTKEEKTHLVYAGKFMIYMQALRFLSDYLNNDIYYGQKYEGQNLIRAENQATLLQRLIEKEAEYQQLLLSIVN